MAEWQAYSCDAVTGAVLDRVPVSAFTYSRLLSAESSGSVTIPLDGTFSREELQNLTAPWKRLLVVERDGVVQFIGYVLGHSYRRGQTLVTFDVADVWRIFTRRLAVDHSVSGVETWQETVTGNLTAHAVAAIIRGRQGVVAPAMGIPLTVAGPAPGPSFSRTYYGYHLDPVADVLADLLDEGLDIYFRPRWASVGVAGWLMLAAGSWGSGVTHEFYVTAELSEVSAFAESVDAARVTNNAVRIGEGSEVDMLVRSNRNMLSDLPLLERQTNSKAITDVAQLSAQALSDLASFGAPTTQWDFQVSGDSPVDVGDTVRLHFDGDPWVADGWHERRVVKVSGGIPGPDFKTIGVQPTGGV